MRIGNRFAVGFDRTAWAGFGLFFHTQTLWVDFLGFYLNLYLGKGETAMAQDGTSILLDEVEPDQDKGTKRDATGDKKWMQHERERDAAFRRQFAVDKAVQVTRTALSQGLGHMDAGEFTVNNAKQILAFLEATPSA